MPCEMCGAKGDTFKANIEGAELIVCQGCAKYGKIISRVKDPVKEKKSVRMQQQERPIEKLRSEIIQVIADDYAEMIRKAREKSGLKQKEFALKVAEKESLIQNLESGKFVPSINLARKLERHLNIKLIEQHEETHDQKYITSKTAITIGDMLSIKK